MTDYAELRVALGDDPDADYDFDCTVKIRDLRALLADHDDWRRQAQHETEVAQAAMERAKALESERGALEVAVKEASEVIMDRNEEILRLREALEKLLDGARAETAESWQCNSYHPKLIAGMDVAADALAEGQSHDS